VPSQDWAGETAAFLGAGELAERLNLVQELVRNKVELEEALGQIGFGIATQEAVASAFLVAGSFAEFSDAVLSAVNAGGATDTRGGLTGALVGASAGANGIPQKMIDGLESRIYVSLAAPWFHKVVLRNKTGVIDLRPRLDGE
jgi:ADP-ribosylglycohydrolase